MSSAHGGASSRLELEASLVKKWKDIEALEEEDGVSDEEFNRHKEAWFGPAFAFLQDLPQEEHCWCGHSEIAWPLLEPFHFYYTVSEKNFAVKVLWRRFSQELRKCTRCVLQYYKAKEMYATEFHEDAVRGLLAILQTLDEERVATHLQEVLCKMKSNSLNSEKDSEEIICVLFEVLRFPTLLDDAEVDTAFVEFLRYVEDTYDLTLAADQCYAGIYALFFHNDQATRRVALRLAGAFGKLRSAADLEPIQSLLQKHMQTLEFDLFDQRNVTNGKWNSVVNFKGTQDPTLPSAEDRPRACCYKESLWMGLKTLLGMLEPPAFEEGVVERYPFFLSIVLNHASEATPVFWNALHCLKLLLAVLGHKLWIKTTFSPGVMRSTLIGQCFHTREEKMHKAIFDLFQPFLQSLEALQDGEYERQRRNILYFLLQQVGHSRNFSGLMSKKARQIAYIIIMRGYKMDPACPPLECVHVWGPSLLESVRDRQLYDSLRQPAVQLLETIIIADSIVLARLNSVVSESKNSSSSDMPEVVEENFYDSCQVIETGGESYLRKFKALDKLGGSGNNWLCAPILWVEILGKGHPADLPDSFSLAVMWASSRLCTIYCMDQLQSRDGEPGNFPEVVSSKSIASSLIWETPKGCDDGADGKLCPNSLKVSCHGSLLVSLLKRCVGTFIGQIQRTRIEESWIWDLYMAEILVLLSLDAHDEIKDFGRFVLSYFTKSPSLDVGLTFLCSSQVSAACAISGLFYATKLLIMNSLHATVSCLQNLLFFAWKLINLWHEFFVEPSQSLTAINSLSITGKEGGVLKQPNYDQPLPSDSVAVHKESEVEKTKNLLHLSSFLWPLLLKVMKDGRLYAEDSAYLMLFTRTFDLLPVVFQNIFSSLVNINSTKSTPGDFEESPAGNKAEWISHFLSWGEVCIVTIHRRWKFAVSSILMHSENMHWLGDSIALKEAKEWLEKGTALSVEVRDKLELLLLLAISGSSKSFISSASETMPSSISFKDGKGVFSMARGIAKSSLKDQDVIILSDDDSEHSPNDRIVCTPTMDGKEKNVLITEKPVGVISPECPSNLDDHVTPISSPRKHMHPISMQKQLGILCSGHSKKATLDRFFGSSNDKPSESSQVGRELRPFVDNADALELSNKLRSMKGKLAEVGSEEREMPSKGNDSVQKKAEARSIKSPTIFKDLEQVQKDDLDAVLKDLVQDESNNDVSRAKKSMHSVPKKGLGLLPNPQPKRQLIQLHVPNEQLRSNAKKPGVAARPPVPRLDEWFKRILSLDYFSVVGLSVDLNEEAVQAESMLKVPLAFRSSQHYMDVFRPLVLEEFRAQLQQSYDQLNLLDEMTTGVLRLISLEKVDDFDIGRFTAEAGADGPARACFENDLLLLSRQPLQIGTQQSVHIIGKVEQQERDNKSHSVKLVLKFYLRSGNKRLVKARSLLLEQSKWHVTRLMSITPQVREFQALSAVEYFPLLPIILNDGSCKMGSFSSKQMLPGISDKLQHRLTADYNASQCQAIDMALRSAMMVNGHELSLVQGPPGTGKTRTILAIISALIASGKCLSGSMESEKFESPVGSLHANANRSVSRSVAIARSWQAAALAREQIQQESSENMQKGREKRHRILVCAQSNAAVDELVSRICKDGLYDSDGVFFRPYLVRVGNAKNVHPNCLPVFIDTLVENKMESNKENCHTVGSSMCKNTAELLRNKLDKVLNGIQALEAQLSKSQSNDAKSKKGIEQDTISGSADQQGSIKMEVSMLYKQRRQIGGELSALEAEEKRSWEETRSKRLSVKKDIIRRAEVVVATLSGCGGDVYSACVDQCSRRRQIRNLDDGLFDAVVIDEAAQALEPATLIPLQLLKPSKAKCILVGDPKQLPATVISQMASRFSFQCSMFERLQRGGHPVSLLSVQYRMHPEIREFPSAHFYENQLQDGSALLEGRKAPFHKTKYLGPYAIFDVVEGHEKGRHESMSQSLCNQAEVDVALEIFRNLMKRYPDEIYPGKIGIITPYQQQLSLLRDQFRRILGQSIAEGIEFNTVDGFQGREVDILIFSTVRATNRNSHSSCRIGFVADVRRMNVALTRARFSLWIVCNAATLQASAPWAALFQNAMERGVLHTVKRPYRGFFDRCHSNKPREEIGCYQGLSSPVGVDQTMPHVEVTTKKHDTGQISTVGSSTSVCKLPKSTNHVEKLSNMLVESVRDTRNDNNEKVVFERDAGTNRWASKYTDDCYLAKGRKRDDKLFIEKSLREINQHISHGNYKGSKDLLKAVSMNQPSHRQDKNMSRLGSSDSKTSIEIMSVDSRHKQSRDNTVFHESLERVDCRDSGGVPDYDKLHGQKESSSSGKKQTDVRGWSPVKGSVGGVARDRDNQIQTKDTMKEKQASEQKSMYKKITSRGQSSSTSKDSGVVIDKVELESITSDPANSASLEPSCSSVSNLRLKSCSIVQSVFVDEIRSRPSDVRIRNLSAVEGVAGDQVLSNTSDFSGANDAEDDMEMFRPLKRPRHEKASGSSFSSRVEKTEAKSHLHVRQDDNTNHAEHPAKNEEYLNKEWERFLKVLNKTKIHFPFS